VVKLFRKKFKIDFEFSAGILEHINCSMAEHISDTESISDADVEPIEPHVQDTLAAQVLAAQRHLLAEANNEIEDASVPKDELISASVPEALASPDEKKSPNDELVEAGAEVEATEAANVTKTNKLTELINCPICHDIYVKPMVGSCGHSICAICFNTKKSTECPICRKTQITYVENYSLKDIVEKSVNPEDYQNRLAEFELSSSVDKNVERIGSLLGQACSISVNKYDDKTTIRLLKKIYDVCSQGDVSTPKKLRSLLLNKVKSKETLTIVYGSGYYNLKPTIIKYYLSITLGTSMLIVCSNKQMIFQ